MDTSRDVDRCLKALQDAARGLGADPDSPVWPELAAMVIQSMTGPWRFFHTPEHIFDVGDGGSPIEVLAALFHDVVYVQVDHGVNLSLARHVAYCLHESPQGLRLNTAASADDVLLQMTLDIFGFQPGQPLNPFAGQNEFLSALVAVKSMQALLPRRVLAQVAVCIEATVPFRGPDSEGLGCSEKMHTRLRAVNERYGLGMDEEEMMRAVEAGVRVANRDIGNFSSEHPATFLDNTWNLIPETNHDLLQVNTYTVKGYRQSLQKMEGFLSRLQASSVFRRYGQEPDASTHAQRLALTQRNLEVASLYLKLKLVSIGVLEALSLRIGPEVPLASMMGHLPSYPQSGLQLEHLLPDTPPSQPPASEIERFTLELLESGRTAESLYDAKHSPVASYLVKAMGFGPTLALSEEVHAFFADAQRGPMLLQRLPMPVLQALSQGVQALFTQRAQAFVL